MRLSAKETEKVNKKSDVQLKTYIDFTEISQKEVFNWKGFLAGTLIICLLAALFGKFAVYDLMKSVDDKKTEVADLQKTLDEYNATIEAEKELPELYYHYTWHDMTQDEKDSIYRASAMEIVKILKNKDFEFKSVSVKANDLNISLTTDSIYKVVDIMDSLKEYDGVNEVIVDSVQRTNNAEDQEEVLVSDETEEELEEDLEEVAEELAPNETVEVQIRITMERVVDSEEDKNP